MQLRVARLCLDCEEVFVGDVCPTCASQQVAYLSTWLPVEERRRWRRAAPEPASATDRWLVSVRQFLRNAFGDGTPVRVSGPPRTRRGDHLPPMDFDKPQRGTEQPRPVTDPRPVRENAR